MISATDVRENLRHSFVSTAEWRRNKAKEHSNDARNEEAAALLDRLAQSLDVTDETLLVAYGELFDDMPDSEQESEILREVGFHCWPQDATEFVRRFIRDRTSGR